MQASDTCKPIYINDLHHRQPNSDAVPTLGKLSEARRAILVAVQLGNNNRFILRCASRFFVHVQELDTAHEILCRADSIYGDPWLLAAEAATAFLSNRKPLYIKNARQLIGRQSYPDSQLSELLSALGTLEFQSGNARATRRLFKRALIEPTENVLAQARWATSRGLQLDISPSLFKIPFGYETRAWRNRYLSNWKLSVDNSKDWLHYQQFETTPAILGSFVAAVALEDHSTATEILEIGLRANPKDTSLLNNLAYSLASKGNLAKAESILKVTSTGGDPTKEIYKLATTGLLRFRQRRIELGRLLYSQAAEKATVDQDKSLRSRVMIFWALEEVRAGTPIAGEISSDALELAKSDDDPIIGILSQRIRTNRISGAARK